MSKKVKQKNVVVIGGGTGTSILLRGLKYYPLNLSAIVTTADTGGSSGKLRAETGMAPPGDVRQCFIALNEDKHPFISYFNTRFGAGNLRGHSFGNLFFAALWQKHGNLQKAIEEAERIFNATHSVITVTIDATNLVAHLKNRRKVYGEARIIKVKNLAKQLKRLQLEPRGVSLNPKAKRAIMNADFIIIGPGNLFGSLTPPFLVKGMAESVVRSHAKKIYVANIMNQNGLTDGFILRDYLAHFENIFGKDIFDFIVCNTKPINEKILKNFDIKGEPVLIGDAKHRYISASLLDTKISSSDPNDPLKRTYIRHDPKKLAAVIAKIIC